MYIVLRLEAVETGLFESVMGKGLTKDDKYSSLIKEVSIYSLY